MAGLTRPLTVAPVGGFSAWALSQLLRAHHDRLAGGVHPQYAEELRATLAGLEQAGRAWVEWRRQVAEIEAAATADGSIAVAEVIAQAASAEVDTTTAAVRLRVTPGRVRQLVRCGRLTGRRAGRVWLVDTAALETYAEGRHA